MTIIITGSRRAGSARRIAGCLLAVPLAAALVACGEAAAGTGGDGQEWREPRDYVYTLTQSCGEQALTGTFRITVTDGRVAGWEPVGENHAPRTVEVPTVGGLLEEAQRAREDGADSVEVGYGEDGDPARGGIDHDAGAVDDESCYEIGRIDPAG